MTTYLIKGINAQGETGRTETAIDDDDMLQGVFVIAEAMLSGWNKFTIEVEALDDEPDGAK